MAQGNYDHPSYLTRQSLLAVPKSTAGNATVQTGITGLAFPYDVRLRNAVAIVGTAGTSTGATAVLYAVGAVVQFPNASVSNGVGTTTGTVTSTTTAAGTATTTIGTVVLSTSTAGVAAQSGDMNVRLPAGVGLLVKNGTDVTSTYSLAVEYYVDPVTASWTGSN